MGRKSNVMMLCSSGVGQMDSGDLNVATKAIAKYQGDYISVTIVIARHR